MQATLDNKNVIIYAAGNDGRSLLRVLKKQNITPLFFIDINASKIKEVDGINVYEPSNLPNTIELSLTVVFIALGNTRFYSDALRNLRSLGFKDIRNGVETIFEINKAVCENILTTDKNEINAANCLNCITKYHECPVFQSSIRKNNLTFSANKLEVPTVSFQVTTRCPHRCKDCIVSVPYIKQADVDLDLLINDIDAYLNNVSYLYRLALGGGELFMYRKFPELLEYLLSHKQIGSLQIATTGVIIPSERLYKVLDNPRISISVSSYGDFLNEKMAQKTEQFMGELKKRNKPYRYNKSIVWYDFGDTSERQRTEKAHKAVFRSCEIRKDCNMIWDGKLYHCSKTHTFDEMDLVSATEEDYVDLRISKNLEQRIKAFYKQDFVNTCRFCDGTSNCAEIPAGIQLEKPKRRSVESQVLHVIK